MNPPIEHIQLVEDVPRTINRNVKVRMIAQKHLIAGETVNDIAEHYEITLSDVYAALAFYYDNKEAFDEKDRENDAIIQQLKPESEAHLARMRARMREIKREKATAQQDSSE